MRRTITTTNTNRFRVLALFLVTMVASLLAVPDVAHAYEVHVSISGAGSITETTPADLLGDSCWTPHSIPTGTVTKDCYPGEPDGPYGWGWVVRYEAHPAPGYQFWKWDSDGDTDPVICDGSFDPEHTGSTCQFATFGNLQTRAFFVDEYPPVEARISSGPTQPVSGPATFVYFLDVASWGEPPDPTFKQFECRVAREDRSILYDWQPCGTNQGHGSLTVDPPEDGLYRFDVRGVDYSENTSIRGFESYLWTVDKTAPTVLDPVSPSGNGVSRTANVIATFSEAMDEASVEAKGPSGTPTTVTLLKKGTTTPLAATVSYDVATRKVMLNPSANLRRGATYTVKITTAAKDEAGNALAQEKVWSFRVKR